MDSSKLLVDDEESCLEFIVDFMNSETLVWSEDSGTAVLLQLNDTVTEMFHSHMAQTRFSVEKKGLNVSNPELNENAVTSNPIVSNDNSDV